VERLSHMFAQLKAAGDLAFIPGIVPGDPSFELDTEIVKTMVQAGADAIELSCSFSDPVADGPTLQAAHSRTLGRGTTKAETYAWIARARAVTDVPLLVLEYANCIFQFGPERFFKVLADNGADSAIVVDVPLEEAAPFRRAAEAAHIGTTFLIAPSTSDARLHSIAAAAREWLYVVALSGITGARDAVQQPVAELLARARGVTALPLVVGFGISRPDHIRRVAQAGAHGAISCSAVVDLITAGQNQPADMLRDLASYVGAMKTATHRQLLA